MHLSQPFRGQRSWLMLLLIIAVPGFFMLDLIVGSVPIPVRTVMEVLTGQTPDHLAYGQIITLIRVPKAVTALTAGGALSIGGLMMQTLFRNPLAGPSVLGINSGASIGVAAVMLSSGGSAGLYTIQNLGISGSWILVLAAIAGAAMVMGLILLISARLKDNIALLIVGIMIGNLTIAIVSVWQFFSAPEEIQDYLIWTFGSFGGVSRDQLPIMIFAIVPGIILAFAGSKSLNTLLLGENYAQSMGLNIRRSRWLIIGTTSLLAGTITGFCGPIAFVGLAVPHICRTLFDTSDHRILIPACLAMGALLMLICDIAAQLPGSSTVLPINAITALIGAPFVVWIVIRQKNLAKTF